MLAAIATFSFSTAGHGADGHRPPGGECSPRLWTIDQRYQGGTKRGGGEPALSRHSPAERGASDCVRSRGYPPGPASSRLVASLTRSAVGGPVMVTDSSTGSHAPPSTLKSPVYTARTTTGTEPADEYVCRTPPVGYTPPASEVGPRLEPSPNEYVNDRTLGRIRTLRPSNITVAISCGATPDRRQCTR